MRLLGAVGPRPSSQHAGVRASVSGVVGQLNIAHRAACSEQRELPRELNYEPCLAAGHSASYDLSTPRARRSVWCATRHGQCSRRLAFFHSADFSPRRLLIIAIPPLHTDHAVYATLNIKHERMIHLYLHARGLLVALCDTPWLVQPAVDILSLCWFLVTRPLLVANHHHAHGPCIIYHAEYQT